MRQTAGTAEPRGEAADLQTLIDKERGGFTLAPWDWQYYAEQVRKASYDLDESQLKPYFELNRVLKDGVGGAANKGDGITGTERKDIPVYQPDVRVFEVRDANGKPTAPATFTSVSSRKCRAADTHEPLTQTEKNRRSRASAQSFSISASEASGLSK